MRHQIFSLCYKLLGFLLCILFWDSKWFIALLIVYFLAFIAIASIGSMNLLWNYHIKSFNKLKNKELALTFDDGPHPEYTPKILSILDDFEAKACFFVIGKNAELYPELIKEIDKRGHILANHSYSHSRVLPFFLTKNLLNDFEQCATLLTTILGKKPQWIRPPFGATSSRYRKMLAKTKMQSVGWNLRSLDTLKNNAEKLVQKILAHPNLEKGAILLLHDTQKVSTEALPILLAGLKQKGIQITSLNSQISTPPYETV